jgi:Berberine and berberine like
LCGAGHGEHDGLVRAAVGADAYARLVAVKRKFDPTSFFRVNQNIPAVKFRTPQILT